jgi:hypothetical protein
MAATLKKARKRFDEIVNEVKDGGMPLGTYLFLHRDAVLTPEQSKTLTDWAGGLK